METTAATDYRVRIRRANGTGTANPRESVTCGDCGLGFEEVSARGDGTDHPLHGACPRCGGTNCGVRG